MLPQTTRLRLTRLARPSPKRVNGLSMMNR
jgi:hypothetical protein